MPETGIYFVRGAEGLHIAPLRLRHRLLPVHQLDLRLSHRDSLSTPATQLLRVASRRVLTYSAPPSRQEVCPDGSRHSRYFAIVAPRRACP